MKKRNDSISDDEIRILGNYSGSNGSRPMPKPSRWKKYSLIVLASLILLGILGFITSAVIKKYNRPVETEQKSSSEITTECNSSNQGHLIINDTVINDIPMRIMEPQHCRMKLHLGELEERDNVVLALLAADVRDDKDLPTGAFVVDGQLIAKGKSKYGFCAIIDNKVTIGRQAETVLFERSIEENGSFFRQYSLVSNGQRMDIPPKGKTFRRALCYLDGKIKVVLTQDKESYHDFSQALVDLGVSEAISLVGGGAYIQYIEENGETVKQGLHVDNKPNSINYLIWTSSK